MAGSVLVGISIRLLGLGTLAMGLWAAQVADPAVDARKGHIQVTGVWGLAAVGQVRTSATTAAPVPPAT